MNDLPHFYCQTNVVDSVVLKYVRYLLLGCITGQDGNRSMFGHTCLKCKAQFCSMKLGSRSFKSHAQHSVHPTGGSRRVFRQFVWLEAGSGKAASSRPAHQRVTPAVGRRKKMLETRSQGMRPGSSDHALHAPLDVK